MKLVGAVALAAVIAIIRHYQNSSMPNSLGKAIRIIRYAAGGLGLWCVIRQIIHDSRVAWFARASFAQPMYPKIL